MNFSVETTINAVVVFPDRARVTARGSINASAGVHELTIGDLPMVMDPESVRVSGAGTAGVRIRSVDVRRRHYEKSPSTDVRALEDQIQNLRNDLQGYDDAAAVKSASLEHLAGLRRATTEYADGLARGKSSIDHQGQLIRFFEEEDTRLRSELRQLGIQQRELHESIAKLQSELEELRSAQARQRMEVVVEIEVVEAGVFEPEVNYVVSRAGWRPLYDMRLLEAAEEGSARLSVTVLGEVSQNTGQDWSTVRLTVSTARPALNQRIPELKPWYVDIFQPQPREKLKVAAMKSQPEADTARTLMLEDTAMMAMPRAAVAETAEIEETGSVFTFVVPGPVDIPGSGTPKKTTLSQSELTPELDYLAIPRHTDAVYRRAKVHNKTGAAMLAGPVNLYVGSEYIGHNRIDFTPVDGEVELVLGVEDRITVQRELVRRDVDKRFLRDQRQIAFGYVIKLENLLPSPARVTVKDQYPVSRHDQINVRLDAISPQPVEQSDLRIVTWKLDLAPGEEQSISYEYQVEHPRSMRVIGLVD